MPPGKDTKSVPFDDTPENASQEDSQQTLNVQQLLDMQKDAVTTRRRKVEDELRKSHKQGFGRLQRRHDEDMAEYEEQLESVQRPFLEKLAELVKRKKLLESEIEKLLGDLQQPNTCMTEQFDACFKSRVNALRE